MINSEHVCLRPNRRTFIIFDSRLIMENMEQETLLAVKLSRKEMQVVEILRKAASHHGDSFTIRTYSSKLV